MTKTEKPQTISLAREADGTIQLTFTIIKAEIEKKMAEVAAAMGQTIEVPGFRKGKAPLKRVLNHIPREQLIERSLRDILPKYFSDAIEKHKLKPAMYPKFELVSAEEGKDWQVRAITCEVPEIELNDYKKEVRGTLAAKNIWSPKKGDQDKRALTVEEKEQLTLKTLLEKIKVIIPHVLIEEEVDAKLASLLSRLETLGLSLESYLASIKKNPQMLRDEYIAQAKENLQLELILNAIAQKEKVEIPDQEVDELIKAAQGDPNFGKSLDEAQQKSTVRSILRKRKVLSMLSDLG